MEYSRLNHLSMDSEILDNQTRPNLVESLMIALTALQIADFYMKKQNNLALFLNRWMN